MASKKKTGAISVILPDDGDPRHAYNLQCITMSQRHQAQRESLQARHRNELNEVEEQQNAEFTALAEQISERNQRLSFFLRDIPPEIRMQIYEYALGGRTIGFQCLNGDGHFTFHEDDDSSLKPRDLLRLPFVSCQIYRESASLIFSLNVFRMLAEDLGKFLIRVGKHKEGYIEQLELELRDSDMSHMRGVSLAIGEFTLVLQRLQEEGSLQHTVFVHNRAPISLEDRILEILTPKKFWYDNALADQIVSYVHNALCCPAADREGEVGSTPDAFGS